MRTMVRFPHFWPLALVTAFVAVLGVWSILDNDPAESATTATGPAIVERIAGSDFSTITLTERAVQRLDIQLGDVSDAQFNGVAKSVVPYGAIFYDSMGNGWVYTNPEGLSYVRAAVTIERIEGDIAILTSGPAIGTKVVSQGAALLYGTEFGVGH